MKLLRAEALATTASDCRVAARLAMTVKGRSNDRKGRNSKVSKHQMRRTITIITLISLSLLGLGLLSQITSSGYTRIELTEEGRGEKILSVVAPDGEPLTLTWRNSQFGYQVTEIFYARGGLIVQDQVTFSEPGGPPPPRVSAADVADLYHTGATFDARGLNRPFSRIVYRIGEIGDPKIRVKNKTAALKKAAGFGGRVILTTAKPKLYEILLGN
jgi:hypothetical protein